METYTFWSIRAPGPRGRRVEDDDAGMEHVETGTFASSFLRPAKLPKLDWKHVCVTVVLCLHMSL